MRVDLVKISIGIVKNEPNYDNDDLDHFFDKIQHHRNSGHWNKDHIIKLFNKMIPGFNHKETGKYLDDRM